MVWYRSTRTSGETGTISHFFQCTTCNGIAEIMTRQRAGGDDDSPGRKTAPFQQRHGHARPTPL